MIIQAENLQLLRPDSGYTVLLQENALFLYGLCNYEPSGEVGRRPPTFQHFIPAFHSSSSSSRLTTITTTTIRLNKLFLKKEEHRKNSRRIFLQVEQGYYCLSVCRKRIWIGSAEDRRKKKETGIVSDQNQYMSRK